MIACFVDISSMPERLGPLGGSDVKQMLFTLLYDHHGMPFNMSTKLLLEGIQERQSAPGVLTTC